MLGEHGPEVHGFPNGPRLDPLVEHADLATPDGCKEVAQPVVVTDLGVLVRVPIGIRGPAGKKLSSL